MNVETAYHVAFMTGCFILILLLLRILLYVRKQNDKIRQLENRVKLIEQAEEKEQEEK